MQVVWAHTHVLRQLAFKIEKYDLVWNFPVALKMANIVKAILNSSN